MLDIFVICVGATLWGYLMVLYHIKRTETPQYYIDEIHSRGYDLTVSYPKGKVCTIIISNADSHYEFHGNDFISTLIDAKEYSDKFPTKGGY
jgi:hypothetical protein